MKIAWLLTRIITPLLSTVPAHLESSLQLINTIKDYYSSHGSSSNKYMCSFDIVSMYTSIPIQDAIDNVIDTLKSNTMILRQTLPIDVIEGLLCITLRNTYLHFDSRTWK